MIPKTYETPQNEFLCSLCPEFVLPKISEFLGSTNPEIHIYGFMEHKKNKFGFLDIQKFNFLYNHYISSKFNNSFVINIEKSEYAHYHMVDTL